MEIGFCHGEEISGRGGDSGPDGQQEGDSRESGDTRSKRAVRTQKWKGSGRIFPVWNLSKSHSQKIHEKYGRIDILVNNAGMSDSAPFTNYTEDLFEKVMDLNVKGVFHASRAVVDYMVEQGSGVILSTSSMVSISGQAAGVAYPTSKFAVNGFTISLARELGPKGIRVNAVAPGITETDMMKAVPKEVIDPLIAQIPLRRLGQPEDIANAFTFLASDEASYITGVILSVDGMSRA